MAQLRVGCVLGAQEEVLFLGVKLRGRAFLASCPDACQLRGFSRSPPFPEPWPMGMVMRTCRQVQWGLSEQDHSLLSSSPCSSCGSVWPSIQAPLKKKQECRARVGDHPARHRGRDAHGAELGPEILGRDTLFLKTYSFIPRAK